MAEETDLALLLTETEETGLLVTEAAIDVKRKDTLAAIPDLETETTAREEFLTQETVLLATPSDDQPFSLQHQSLLSNPDFNLPM